MMSTSLIARARERENVCVYPTVSFSVAEALWPKAKQLREVTVYIRLQATAYLGELEIAGTWIRNHGGSLLAVLLTCSCLVTFPTFPENGPAHSRLGLPIAISSWTPPPQTCAQASLTQQFLSWESSQMTRLCGVGRATRTLSNSYMTEHITPYFFIVLQSTLISFFREFTLKQCAVSHQHQPYKFTIYYIP